MTRPALRWNAICIDCAPPEFAATVAFYRSFLDRPLGEDSCIDPQTGTCSHEGDDHWARIPGPDSDIHVLVQAEPWYEPPAWPEQPTTRQTKMMHFEVRVEDVPDSVAFAVSCGATESTYQPHDRNPDRSRVMLDPAGHPFCLWTPTAH